MPSTKVLLSKENPQGFKLEELLQLLITDIQIKSDSLSNSVGGKSAMACSHTDVMCEVLQNNREIEKMLRSALSAQLSSLRALEVLGTNRGPNHPRL